MTDRTPQAIIPFQSPISRVTIYTATSLQSQLHYTYWGKDDWHVILPNTDNAHEIQPGTTLHLSWNPVYPTVTYDVRNGTSLIAQQANVALVSSLSLPIPTPTGQTQPESSAPSSAPPATAPSEASRISQPTESSSNTAQPTASKPLKSDGLAAGPVAGLAIGSLIVGALLASIILWFCWRRRKPTQHRKHEASGISLIQQEKGFSTQSIYPGRGSPASSRLAGALPLPLEDKAITGEVSKIGNSIKNHVQSYYHTGRVSPGQIDYDDVQALGTDLPISAGTLSTLLSNSATREIALRFCIAWVVCAKMLPNKDPGSSLLPVEVAQCLQVMSDANTVSRVQAISLARWRGHTAELLQPAYVRNPYSASDNRVSNIQAIIRALENILRPYADSRMDNEQRKRNLEEIIKRSATFAFTLFSQPSTWVFDWKEEQGVRSGELCVFPALLQVTDEAGELVSPPRPFSEAIVRHLDG